MSQGCAQSFVGNNAQWYCEKYIMIKIANAIQVSVSTQAINNPAITNKGITIFLGSLLPLKEKVGMLLTINSPTKTNQAEIK